MIELEQGTADALSVPTSRSSIATAPPSGASSCLSDRLTRLAGGRPFPSARCEAQDCWFSPLLANRISSLRSCTRADGLPHEPVYVDGRTRIVFITRMCGSALFAHNISAAPGGGWAVMSGTSMATPQGAGVAALWTEKLRNEGVLQVPESVRSAMRARGETAPAHEGPGRDRRRDGPGTSGVVRAGGGSSSGAMRLSRA